MTEEKKTEVEKESERYKEEIKYLKSQIVKVKFYDRESLAEYFFQIAKCKKWKPSLRDLEKGSEDWKKDKWGYSLKNDYKLIGNIFMRLHEEKNRNAKLENESWFQNLYNEFQNKFADIQMKESK